MTYWQFMTDNMGPRRGTKENMGDKKRSTGTILEPKISERNLKSEEITNFHLIFL